MPTVLRHISVRRMSRRRSAGSFSAFLSLAQESYSCLLWLAALPALFGGAVYAQTIATSNLHANQVTLGLTSGATSTGYFTLLQGSGAACGTATQVRAGQTGTGALAYRHGSLPLSATVAGSYTVRGLRATTSYTVCFTPDGTATPVTSNVTTEAAVVLTPGQWAGVGSAGFSPGQVGYVSLAFAPDGTPYIAFNDDANNQGATVEKFNGTAWVVVGSADFSAGSAEGETLAFAPDGTPYVAYQDDANNQGTTVQKFNGTAWVVVGTPNLSMGASRFESLAFSPDGTLYVAYADYSNNSASGNATVQAFNGSAWNVVGSPAFSAAGTSFESLAFSPDGTPYVSYDDDAHSDAITVQKYTGSWSVVGTAGFSAGTASYSSLTFSLDGTPYVAYQDYANGDKATVQQFNGTAWVLVGPAGFSSGVATFLSSLAFGSDGAPYLAYNDQATGATAKKFNGTAWTGVGNGAFAGGGLIVPALAFGPDGSPYVAYEDRDKNFYASVLKLVPVASATTGVATSVTATTATLNGTANDNGVATTLAFDYLSQAYGSPTTTVAATTPVGGNLPAGSGNTAASVDITGLTPGQAYIFRLDATINGLTTKGIFVTFSTPLVPAITAIGPTSGPPAGGTQVEIDGSGFTDATMVSFGSVAATSFFVDFDRRMYAVSPAGTPGIKDIRVTTAGGTSPIVAADQFTYNGLTATVSVPAVSANYGAANTTLTANVSYPTGATKPSSVTLQVDAGTVVAATCSTANPAVCTASYPTAALTAGMHTITGTVVADALYSTASGTGTLTITQATATTPITFTVPNHTYGDAPFTVSASSASTGAFTYSVVSGPATIAGSTVTLTGAGTVVLQAAQAADANYAANTKSASFTSSQATTPITFTVPNHTYGDAPFTVSASSASTGAFTYSVISGPATIAGNTVTLTGAGTVVLQASQAADANYAANTKSATFTTSQATTPITFTVPNHTYGDAPFTVSASSASTGAFTYSVVSGPATIAGNTVTLIGAGTVVLQASQAADVNYAANTKAATFTTGQATAPITFAVANHTYGDAPFTVSASSSSTGAFTYSVISGPATIAGNVVTLTAAGTVVLQAAQAADANYAANTTSASFSVSQAAAAITFAVPNHTFGDAPFAVSASSSSAGAFTYTVVSGPATVSGNTVTLTGAGTVLLQASQAAAAGYSAGSRQASFTVGQATVVVSFSMPAPVVYGTSLSGTQLNATAASNGAAVAGTFAYTPAAGTVPNAGTQTLTVQFTPTNTTNYATPAAASTTLVVTAATTSTTITTSAPTAVAGASVTFTATVAASSGPAVTGSVTFSDGTTTLGSAALVNGAATYTTAALAAGSHTVTAVYGTNGNDAASTGAVTQTITAATTPTTPASPFTLTDGGTAQIALTVRSSYTTQTTLTVTPAATFAGVVTFSCVGLPANTTCGFIPPTLTFAGGTTGAQTSQLSIRTAVVTTAQSSRDSITAPRLAVILWAPGLLLAGVGMRSRKLRARGRWTLLALMLLGLAGTAGLAGCGSTTSFLTPAAPGTYSFTVVATSGSTTQTLPIALTIQ